MTLTANGRFEVAVDLQRALLEGLPANAPEPTSQHLRHNLARFRSRQLADRPWPGEVFAPAGRLRGGEV